MMKEHIMSNAKKPTSAKKKLEAAPEPEVIPEGSVTVGDMKIQYLTQRLGQQEARHAEEIVNLQVQHLMDTQGYLARIAELEADSGD